MDRTPKIVLTVLLLLAAMLVGPMSQAQTTAPKAATLPAESHAPSTAEKTEPTLLSVAEEYVKVVGGAITVVGTLLGFPLVYQTFRKTRAEIAKIDLEAAKLRKELGETAPAKPVTAPDGYRINVEGEGNGVSILTDPRWAAPLLVLVDAFIA
jgi:Na+-transporting methylmalonyl-CoA/oxaloacetate decarboxylase gamma subunit